MNPEIRSLNRRRFIHRLSLAGAGLLVAPYVLRGATRRLPTPTRQLGRTGFAIPLFSLGGQGSLQWTGPGIDPVAIIVKAYETGVRYFDTSNVYGPSQLNYGRAFRQLGLVPGAPGYDERRRRGVFIATKTGVRSNRGDFPGVRNFSDGGAQSSVVDDLHRSLSQMFGDGRGNFPEGAYLDSVQLHAISRRVEIDALFEGYDHPTQEGRVGSLAVLRDYRDGTDHTGLNPGRRRLLRHIGLTGHQSSDALMYGLWRDTQNLFDTLLVPANANDRRYTSHIHNVIPVAAAKGLGIVSMKVFADGTFYGKAARFSKAVADVVLQIGSPELPSARLVQYPLSVPGVTTNIVGIGGINADPAQCQLTRNWQDSQIEAPLDRRELGVTEELAGRIVGGATNYFQAKPWNVRLARNCQIERAVEGERTVARLTWDCALAGADPIAGYEILRDGRPVGHVPHRLQLTLKPFEFADPLSDRAGHSYEIRTTDTAGLAGVTPPVALNGLG